MTKKKTEHKRTIFTSDFWLQAGERALKTFAQTAIAMFGAEALNVFQADILATLGVSLGATNYLLRALMEKGAIKIQNFQASRKKLSYVYLLTPVGIAEKARLTTRFLSRKRAEYEAALQKALDAGAKVLADGGAALRAWLQEGRIQCRVDLRQGLRTLPAAFLDLFKGANEGTLLVANDLA